MSFVKASTVRLLAKAAVGSIDVFGIAAAVLMAVPRRTKKA